MRIKIFLTGGTIDKIYSVSDGKLAFGKTHLPAMLKRANCRAGTAIEELMLEDSLDIADAERNRILEACRHAKEERILVTHGTDTMVETARLLGQSGLGKTIVLTGAMIPYDLRDSDAFFNLGFAMSAVQQAPQGVYIAMNAQLFEWDKVRKNYDKGIFEEG